MTETLLFKSGNNMGDQGLYPWMSEQASSGKHIFKYYH